MERFTTEFDQTLRHAWHLFTEGREIPRHDVPETIHRSWSRSREYGLNESARILFDPVPRARLRELSERHRILLEHVQPDMTRLFDTLDSRDWVLAFIEAEGCVVASIGGEKPDMRDVVTALRPGVNLSEHIAGTSGPGCALAEGRPVVVSGGEHFFEAIRRFSCAAVPVMSPEGRVAGVLNGSRCHDGRPMGIVEPLMLAARSIENRMVQALPDTTLIRLHCNPAFVASPLAGVVALSEHGTVLGATSYARHLLGLESNAAVRIDEVLDTTHTAMLDTLRATDTPARFWRHNGVGLHVQLMRRDTPRMYPAGTSHPAAEAAGQRPCFDRQASRSVWQAERVYAQGLPVLINGETGTGKEVLARHLHESGPRRHGPFVAINCSAIPTELIESELFGYEPGAFTGASRHGKPGKFEQANGGTLFLDEIGDMPLALQARLLRVIQERTVTRLGGTRLLQLDCALLCATHRDLKRCVQQGEFREDLYYRINGLSVTLTPLRAREDFDALIDALLDELGGADGRLRLDSASRQRLRRHRWPGNIRELQQVLRLGAALTHDGVIRLEDLPLDLAEPASDPIEPGLTLQSAERAAIAQALVRNGGNVSATARELGVARATIYRKLQQFGLELPRDTCAEGSD
ncbi:sigma-54-dependent Fis family transcriptional regulator [Nitrogeniibacter mangrovi]|uniref:Sigma-54-dependent Fis family transcriptional regulator n=1 Tax=Nitrogeniibacter mangrovi TaxID=2016596 RepID=A0A6C1B503_9RHOO|nr:sigma-54-dependent Fis family transcriptional regulator [Nitrogeniibacter mangrovi]QID17945.1 sigma-54-dependent Fis family transcriptional regulator [Nitrogeniibacter mangrovi]